MEIRKVAVIGGGRMGRQIALNAAINGYQVKVTDNIPAVLTDIENWKEFIFSVADRIVVALLLYRLLVCHIHTAC